jgi:hypothetical protein
MQEEQMSKNRNERREQAMTGDKKHGQRREVEETSNINEDAG